MVKRHMMGIHKYPHAEGGKGTPYEGISNLRPESKETVKAFQSCTDLNVKIEDPLRRVFCIRDLATPRDFSKNL